nr:MAG TPA: hypothetical protein [Caudoviricetes sp.]
MRLYISFYTYTYFSEYYHFTNISGRCRCLR